MALAWLERETKPLVKENKEKVAAKEANKRCRLQQRRALIVGVGVMAMAGAFVAAAAAMVGGGALRRRRR